MSDPSGIRVSIVIATYNRSRDLLQTLPQVLDVMSPSDELIVVDQTTPEPPEVSAYYARLAGDARTRVLRLSPPSLTVARNVGLVSARGGIVLFLDDDVDVEPGLLERHLKHYEDPDVKGVAGGYYMGTRSLVWRASGTAGEARSITGVHMSFRREALLMVGGADVNFCGAAAGEDWELGERVRRDAGRIANGGDCLVFHRISADGGCGNRHRDSRWYQNAYQNHVYWMLKRPWPQRVTMVPRHLYWIVKYHRPRRSLLLQPGFLLGVVPRAVAGGIRACLAGPKPPFWTGSAGMRHAPTAVEAGR